MFRSSFSETGLAIGQGDKNLPYIYGLSDFWAYMFEESDKTNLLMEGTSQVCSDTYSHFLQLTSTLSLENIQITSGYQLKLVLISEADFVANSNNVYNLTDTIVDTRYIADRPFLPKVLLEKEVHYSFINNGTQVQLSAPIASFGFPVRMTSDGVNQYAMWFVDAELDEQFISDYYAKLIGVSPEASTENFKNFVFGLFYLYTNGPTVALMRKGLNIALGIPLARGVETILQISRYLDTSQYIVVTDQNSYIIPYGLTATRVNGTPLVVGDVVQPLDELAQWVQVTDYVNSGKWWINLMIPQTIMPNLPNGVTDRHAIAGSALDTVMMTWLKSHTFLVNVNNINFENIQFFEKLSTLITKAKPTYTYPIYIWSVPLTEVIKLTDVMTIGWNINKCDPLATAIDRFNRNAVNPVYRGCPQFIRSNVPTLVSDTMGDNADLNGLPGVVDGGTFSKFINPQGQYRSLQSAEIGWIHGIMCRSSDNFRKTRGTIAFTRGVTNNTDGVPVRVFQQPSDYNRIIPLYITTQADLVAKFATIPALVPTAWTFTLFKTSSSYGPIDSTAVNASLTKNYFTLLQTTFSTMFFPITSTWLGDFMPKNGYQTYAPLVGDLVSGDYLLFIRIMDQGIGVYWVTSNQTVNAPPYFPITNADPVHLEMNAAPIMHGLGPLGSPYYLLRGASNSLAFTKRMSVNSFCINSRMSTSYTLPITYQDTFNPLTTINRNGVPLNHRRDLTYANLS